MNSYYISDHLIFLFFGDNNNKLNHHMFNFTSILQNITSNKLITNISDKYKKMK